MMLIGILWNTIGIKLPKKVPNSMQKEIDKLKKTKTQLECLKKAYKVITSRFNGYRFLVLAKPHYLFYGGINHWWHRPGKVWCTTNVRMLEALLLKSGKFTRDEIKVRWTTIWIVSLHVYLKVKIEGKWMNIDPWGSTYGVKFGDYAHGFNH